MCIVLYIEWTLCNFMSIKNMSLSLIFCGNAHKPQIMLLVIPIAHGWLTLYMLNCVEGLFLWHSDSTGSWKFILTEYKDPFISYRHYHSWWWLGNRWNQGISSHGIDIIDVTCISWPQHQMGQAGVLPITKFAINITDGKKEKPMQSLSKWMFW